MNFETRIAGLGGKLRIEGAGFRYEQNGQASEGGYSVLGLEAGCHCVSIGGRIFRVTPGAPGEWMVNGRPVAVEVTDPRELRGRKSAGASDGRIAICASMPGKVVRVLVAAGDSVTAGQGLVVVEAMKMQNEMKSPKEGRVLEVRTRPEAAVVAGEVLLVVE